MRSQSAGRVAYQAGFFDAGFANGWFGWLRAGFFSFAYRLARLRLPRQLAVGALAAIFILV